MKIARKGLVSLTIAALMAFGSPAPAQKVTVERLAVHGASLEGNREGNAVAREVLVVLPPSYAANPAKRYPVLYFLHGFTSNAQDNLRGADVEAALAAVSANGAEMIVVLPDAFTRHAGAMYSNSPTTGDFERYLAHDLVRYVDSKYRTIATRESRGLAGHSMGGYGTIKLGMKYPEVYSSIYAMSPCCLVPQVWSAEQLKRLKGMTLEQAQAGDFMTKAGFASLAAWSPSPDNAPFYMDFGLREDGTVDPLVAARMAANAPIVMLPQYLHALASHEAFAIDIGDKDFLLADAQKFRAELQRFGVKHEWELYEGDHVNRIAQQFRGKVLPFFQRHLDAE